MLNLYNNHTNKNLKFKMELTGIDAQNINPRLIIECGGKAEMIKGEIEGDECKFNIPVLERFDQGNNGRVYYEVIIESIEDGQTSHQYEKLWEQEFETISKTEIKVLESNISEEKKERKIKPSINLTAMVEEVKPEEIIKEEIKIEETVEMEKNDNIDKIYTESKDDIEESKPFSFDVFMKNKFKNDK